MTQNFKRKVDSLLDNDSDISAGVNQDHAVTSHGGASHARVLLLVLPDGNESFWHYSYLIKADFEKDSGNIVLHFTTDTITLKGLRLYKLYRELSRHEPHTITVMESRYSSLTDSNTPLVTAVEIVAK